MSTAHPIREIVTDFAQNLKSRLDDTVKQKVKIRINPSIETWQVCLAISCFNTEVPEFSQYLFWITYNTLGDVPAPITLCTRLEKTKILTTLEELQTELNRMENNPEYLKILETIATQGQEEEI